MSTERRNKAFSKFFSKTLLAFENENNCQNNSLKIQVKPTTAFAVIQHVQSLLLLLKN